jgi:hypothetical protein
MIAVLTESEVDTVEFEGSSWRRMKDARNCLIVNSSAEALSEQFLVEIKLCSNSFQY